MIKVFNRSIVTNITILPSLFQVLLLSFSFLHAYLLVLRHKVGVEPVQMMLKVVRVWVSFQLQSDCGCILQRRSTFARKNLLILFISVARYQYVLNTLSSTLHSASMATVVCELGLGLNCVDLASYSCRCISISEIRVFSTLLVLALILCNSILNQTALFNGRRVPFKKIRIFLHFIFYLNIILFVLNNFF